LSSTDCPDSKKVDHKIILIRQKHYKKFNHSLSNAHDYQACIGSECENNVTIVNLSDMHGDDDTNAGDRMLLYDKYGSHWTTTTDPVFYRARIRIYE